MKKAKKYTRLFIKQLASSPLPDDTKKSIYLHLTKPWIPDFRTIALAPNPGKDGMEQWFHAELFKDDKDRSWYFPSAKWFIVHANTSHAPEGTGCSPEKHIHFLSREGQGWEFDYANVLTDGSAKLMKPDDFYQECIWWRKNFGS